MTVTEADIQVFSEFARLQAINGGTNITMGELAAKWEAVRERATANCAIRDSLSDIEAGRTEAFFESQDKLRRARTWRSMSSMFAGLAKM